MEKEELKKIFAQSSKMLPEPTLEKFLLEKMAVHYFPMFLKNEKVAEGLQELSHFESVQWQLSLEDWGALNSQSFLQINPSLQTVKLRENVFVLWRIPGQSEVQKIILNKAQAHCLESLHLDRQFQISSLHEWMLAHHSALNLTESQWSILIQNLIQQKIIY